MKIENYARALDRLSAIQSSMAQNGDFSLLMMKGCADITTLSKLEKNQFHWAMLEGFGAYEFMFLASETNDIPDEVWQRWSSIMAYMMTFPGVQTWWKINPSSFTTSFTTYVDSINSDNPTDMKTVHPYNDFLSDEKVNTD